MVTTLTGKSLPDCCIQCQFDGEEILSCKTVRLLSVVTLTRRGVNETPSLSPTMLELGSFKFIKLKLALFRFEPYISSPNATR